MLNANCLNVADQIGTFINHRIPWSKHENDSQFILIVRTFTGLLLLQRVHNYF